MACTKETYTATATWTLSQVADLFRDAFIDAGLMTDWYDSFVSSGFENRILEVVYDATKAYGKTYYWFKFGPGGHPASLNIATGWNNVTHLPTGTQYLDYFDTNTNQNNFFYSYAITGGLSNNSTAQLTRYTSGVNPGVSWFVINTSGNRRCFTIVSAAENIWSAINLNNGYLSGFHYTILSTSGNMGTISWGIGPLLRREVSRGQALRGATDWTSYVGSIASERSLGYAAVGRQDNGQGSNWNIGQPFIFLPVGSSSANPAFTQNSNPVFHSIPYSPLVAPLPSDFGITFHYATNIFSIGDTFVVSAGTEEWEVLDFYANGSSVTGASPLFLARMV